jgi:hypothetical protein
MPTDNLRNMPSSLSRRGLLAAPLVLAGCVSPVARSLKQATVNETDEKQKPAPDVVLKPRMHGDASCFARSEKSDWFKNPVQLDGAKREERPSSIGIDDVPNTVFVSDAALEAFGYLRARNGVDTASFRPQ